VPIINTLDAFNFRCPCMPTSGIFVRKLGQILAHFRLNQRATRDGRHDHDRVAVFHRRVRPGSMTNVLVVQVDVDEVAQHVLIVVEMPAQRRVCGRERIQRLARRLCFDDDLRLASRKLPQRRRYRDCY
jgi:hypothetical protein